MDDQRPIALSEPDQQRARHRLALEFGSREEFEDPRFAYRRLFAEGLGTFLLVLAAAGGGILHAKGQISLSAAVVAPGLTVMAVILFMGAVSGAHLNPVVSIAFAMRHDFAWRRIPWYVLAQLVGATLAALFLLAVFGNVEHLGATLPGPGYHTWQALLLEITLTAGLVGVILGTASRAQNVGSVGALGVGGYIAAAGLWAVPVSGASMNPARSFGPALVSGDWTAYWVYVLGPLVGAVIAVGCAVLLRGGGGDDPIARAAASGTLGLGLGERPPSGGDLMEVAPPALTERFLAAVELAQDVHGGGRPMLERIEKTFGRHVAAIVEGCSDSMDGGSTEPWVQRKRRYLAHLPAVEDDAILRVALADKVHNARSIVRDYREEGEALWARFPQRSAREQLWYYSGLVEFFQRRRAGPLTEDLWRVVGELTWLVARDQAQHGEQIRLGGV